ncbi:MAG: TonB-dependent receptor [Gemmatimonadetes bacterium]|nr:TonB-dependent receptor [Gemmatimonadota bacterium]
MIRALLAALTAVSFTTASLSAQAAAPGELHGVVVNGASKRPLPNAVIELTRGADSTIRGRANAAADGAFRITGLALGTYRVRVRSLGYAPRLLPAVLSTATPILDLGTVALAASTVQLEKLVVTGGQTKDVQLNPDRNTYVVRDMPSTKGGNALDVLRNVPSVDVDIDNVVSLRGNSGVTVQINGRPSPMKPAQLGNFLSQLPANMVAKIEVIPNPSAKDDPEGVAGIINIVLKQESDAGTSGALTVAGATNAHAEIGANAGTQKGPLTLFGSYGFLRDNRPRTEALYRDNLYLTPVTYLDESSRRTQVPMAHSFTGSATYELAKHDELSAEMLFTTRKEDETNGILYRDLNSARALTGLSDRYSSNVNHETEFESTLGYKHSFAGQQHKLTSELRFAHSTEGGPVDFTARRLTLDGAPMGQATRESRTAWDRPSDGTLKVDYARPLSSVMRLETGYKGSMQRFHTTLDTRVLDTTRAAYFPDTSRISDFTYAQDVNAAYGMLVSQLGRFVLQGGLRAERATTQFHLNSKGATYDNNYNSLFPSGLVLFNFDDTRQVKLSYSTRIRRPDDTDVIDPTLHFLDPLNVSRGNPNLKPEYIRAIELGLQRSGDRVTMQLTPFFRHTIDAVRTIRSIDTLGVTTRTFANVATSNSYGTDATVALHGGRLSGFMGASAFRQESNAANLSPGLSAHTFGWTARTNASLRVSKGFDLQSIFFYQAPTTVEQGRNASRTRFNLAARQKMMDDRLNLTLRVIDPFNTSVEKFTTNDPRFIQVSNRRRIDRSLLLSVTWNFGKPPEEEKLRDQGGDQGGGGLPPG